jgi:hypothetical protein
MAKSKPLAGKALKSLRSGLAKLKSAGLFSGDVRGAKGGWRQKSLLKRFADVIQGKAKTVKVGAAAKAFDETYRARMGRVVVKAEKGETLRFNKRAGAITSTTTRYGVKVKRIVPGRIVRTAEDLPKAPKGKKYFYKLPHNPMRDYQGTKEEFAKYANKKGYGEAIEIYELNADDFPGDDDE